MSADNHGKATLINTAIVFNCSSHNVGVNSGLKYKLMLNTTISTVVGQNPSATGLFTVQASSFGSSGTYECVALINGVRSTSSNAVTVHIVGKMILPSHASTTAFLLLFVCLFSCFFFVSFSFLFLFCFVCVFCFVLVSVF